MIFCNTKRTFFYELHMIYHNNMNDIIRPYIITYMVGYEITVCIRCKESLRIIDQGNSCIAEWYLL